MKLCAAIAARPPCMGAERGFCVSVVANIVVVAAVVVVAVFVRGTLVGGTTPTARSPESSARPVVSEESNASQLPCGITGLAAPGAPGSEEPVCLS